MDQHSHHDSRWAVAGFVFCLMMGAAAALSAQDATGPRLAKPAAMKMGDLAKLKSE